jgi:hypothetical protein
MMWMLSSMTQKWVNGAFLFSIPMQYVTDLLLLQLPFELIQEHHVTERKEEEPVALNAFELISRSAGLNLGNLFDSEQVWDAPDSTL